MCILINYCPCNAVTKIIVAPFATFNMPSKRRSADKRKAVTFHLVHRSQQDPLITDETAPQHVLAECAGNNRRERQMRYGVYFDDDYDYLQHLRLPEYQQVVWTEAPAKSAFVGNPEASGGEGECGEKPALLLPSSLFASQVQERVGLMNRAAPDNCPPRSHELDLTGDEFKNLSGSGEESELEDNFVDLAGGVASDQGSSSDEVWTSDEDDVGRGFDGNSATGVSFAGSRRTKKTARSRVTDFSTATSRGVLSTVAMERLNEQFDSLMQQQYDDMEVGALDCHEIGGGVAADSQRVLSLADQYNLQRLQELQTKPLSIRADGDSSTEHHVRQQTLYDPHSGEEDHELVTVYEERREDRLDCESILSTYSCTRHLPALIDDSVPAAASLPPSSSVKLRAIRLDSRGRVIEDNVSLTRRALKRFDQQLAEQEEGNSDGSSSLNGGSLGGASLLSRISLLSVPRPPGETSEQRRERKHELKDLRRLRRQERKANRLLTGEMLKRQRQSMRDGLAARQTIIYQ